jgi:Cu/Zn superoxide dismutase
MNGCNHVVHPSRSVVNEITKINSKSLILHKQMDNTL